MKHAVATIVIAAFVAVGVAGCDTGTKSSTSSKATPVVTTSPSSVSDAKAAALDSQVKADDAAAQKRIADVTIAVTAASTPGDKLTLIVTEYCNIPVISAGVDGAEGLAGETRLPEDRELVELYERYWRAGYGWSRDLYSAAKRPDACPEMFVYPTKQAS